MCFYGRECLVEMAMTVAMEQMDLLEQMERWYAYICVFFTRDCYTSASPRRASKVRKDTLEGKV